jgi:uncharacterized protein (TIGR02246 family)
MDAPLPIAPVLDRFVAGFNGNDLEQVMTFFAEDAVYRPGDGSEHRGKAAIRQAFAPQFGGVYGEMQFLVDDRLVDEPARKAAIRWVCRHDFSAGKGRHVPWPQRWLFRVLYGPRCGWYGTDIFHFDRQGKIVAKYTYANYKRPRIRRDLGGAPGSSPARSGLFSR